MCICHRREIYYHATIPKTGHLSPCLNMGNQFLELLNVELGPALLDLCRAIGVYQRVDERSSLCREDFPNRAFIRCIGGESVDGFGGNAADTAR